MKGQTGFTNLKYNGKDVLENIENTGTSIAYFQHIYRSGYPALGSGETPKGEHYCLKSGFWCWSNARENPIMALRYLWWKVTGL